MPKDRYQDYYKNHYKVTFSDEDISRWCGWFTGEWKHIRKYIKFKRGMRVLDIGSGSGGFYEIMRREGVQLDYVGLDLDPTIVDFANKHFKVRSFRNQKFEDHKPRQKYDLIVAFEVLEHVDDPGKFVQRIYKLLNPRGMFIGTTPFPFKKNIVSDATHVSVLHPLNWERLFKNSGFKKVSSEPMTYLPGLWRISPAINVRIPFYIGLPKLVSTSFIQASK